VQSSVTICVASGQWAGTPVGVTDSRAASLAATVPRLLTAEPNLTARDLLSRWPPDAARPSPPVLHRHLSQAVARDEIICTGAGHRYEPSS
jgi:hypothetical protein